jgi:pyruvate dehydrogenase E2 component (dihydrolipoamide acetyltransferase)
MSVSVTMPRLGESVTEGTVTRWLKNEGDHVDADEPLLEVSTDKVDTEVPSPAAGVLTSIKVREDETVEIGVELAVIGGDDDAAPATEEPSGQAEAEAPQQPHGAEQRPPEAAVATPPEGEEETSPESAPRPQSPSALTPEGDAVGDRSGDSGGTETEALAPEQPTGVTPPDPAPAATPPQAPAPSTPGPDGGGPRRAVPDEDEDAAGAYVTPLVRRLASEHGVDLSAVAGTGVGGRIRKSDVLAAAQRTADGAPSQRSSAGPTSAQPASAGGVTAPSRPSALPTAPEPERVAPAPTSAAPAPQRGRTEKLSRRRQLIASRMVESLQVSAQLTTVVEVDVTRIARLREAAKRDFEAREGVKLTFLPFFASATVEALKVHPVLNASIDTQAGTITYSEAEHLGIAVDTEGGLTVPVIHNAGDLNLGGLARKIADLAERTRSNRISPDELGGGTFTLTNTGSRGALFDTPIINQPQVGILGTGLVVKRPVVVSDAELGETIAVRSMVYLALSYDHRIVDGADAARFLGTIKERLEGGGSYQRALGLS